MNFEETLQKKVDEVESMLSAYLPKEEGYQKTVLEAMRYSLMAGGKRLRPILMQETYALFGGQGDVVKPFMAAIEMIHTYSLIHDDLPAMDNDRYRRGKETAWVVYGEAMAILAGDALLNYAFETAVKAFLLEPGNPAVERAMGVLAERSGIFGMIGGQTADIEAEDAASEDVDEALLLFIHEHKTAALIQNAMMIGAILAGAKEKEIEAVKKAAYNIGIAFQIQDDILDVTSNLEVLGKAVGSDEKNHKVTYVTLKGMEQSKEDVRRLSEEAMEILSSFSRRNLFLEELVEGLITREK